MVEFCFYIGFISKKVFKWFFFFLGVNFKNWKRDILNNDVLINFYSCSTWKVFESKSLLMNCFAFSGDFFLFYFFCFFFFFFWSFKQELSMRINYYCCIEHNKSFVILLKYCKKNNYCRDWLNEEMNKKNNYIERIRSSLPTLRKTNQEFRRTQRTHEHTFTNTNDFIIIIIIYLVVYVCLFVFLKWMVVGGFYFSSLRLHCWVWFLFLLVWLFISLVALGLTVYLQGPFCLLVFFVLFGVFLVFLLLITKKKNMPKRPKVVRLALKLKIITFWRFRFSIIIITFFFFWLLRVFLPKFCLEEANFK